MGFNLVNFFKVAVGSDIDIDPSYECSKRPYLPPKFKLRAYINFFYCSLVQQRTALLLPRHTVHYITKELVLQNSLCAKANHRSPMLRLYIRTLPRLFRNLRLWMIRFIRLCSGRECH